MHQALEDSHVDLPRHAAPASADLTQRAVGELEKRSELLPPLVEEVTPVDDD